MKGAGVTGNGHEGSRGSQVKVIRRSRGHK